MTDNVSVERLRQPDQSMHVWGAPGLKLSPPHVMGDGPESHRCDKLLEVFGLHVVKTGAPDLHRLDGTEADVQ